MKIRDATIRDVEMIHSLISSYAELDKMLFRSLSDIYENLQVFKVAEVNSVVVGCCALQVIWSDLAEIKSLTVEKGHFDKGIGSVLVEACLEKANEMCLEKIFTLTLEPEFFEKLGFERVPKEALPMKVWSDCAKCPKQDHCDEIALVYELP